MTTLTGQFIFLCWAAFIIYWIVASFGGQAHSRETAGMVAYLNSAHCSGNCVFYDET